MLTSISFAICLDHIPVAKTTYSHSIFPYLVSTPILNTYDFIDLSGCVKYIEHLNTAEECKVRGQDIDQKNEYLRHHELESIAKL